ncbi:hypothetical protein AJ80_02557 [Polytolypa hystricis UAMH7299]|uniref:COP9 signalosome complex subunit 6 n=1 Tax=Polytolypa hystricis (strain UAMH7299) TaxID=1447883 RepID=A0A2B7YS60_POLH7|nr:hypothetical protein AJ80_02557 [Polytolypa hystricis UAMH7299]
MADSPNILVSSKSSDSGLQVHLHPLVLLNISDHITRHAVRQQTSPIIGALLGQQKGRTISLEHVFECNVIHRDGETILHQDWFEERVKQFKDVHKAPALDLLGWFTVTPPSGPTSAQLPIHRQILQDYNETAIMLAFHASELENISSATGKLPITIYESTYEEETTDDGDKSMQIDGQQPNLALRFRELPYSVETGEAEMISVDFVARGGGNATAISAAAPAPTPPLQTEETQKLRTRRAKAKDSAAKKEEEGSAADETSPLSPEDEDLIANLKTRLNAVKTLESRLDLIKAYLLSISANTNGSSTKPSHTLLRNIYSLISHLSLLSPQDAETFSAESLAQTNDVALVALLSQFGQSLQALRELGKKSLVEGTTRQSHESRKAHMAIQARMDDEIYLRRGLGGVSGPWES